MKRFLHVKNVPKLYCANVDSFKYSKTVPTHELLTRLNYISHPKAGLVNWLPAGLSSMNKISNVVRKRMNEIDFEELGLSLISHNSSWKKTGRWETGLEFFKLDGKEYLLVPTAEEEITNHVASHLTSYKNLPLLYYQINPKFRNEKRPRSGLLRGKEFIMKDAYSFDIDEKSAMTTYNNVIGAYTRIFQDLRLPFTKAAADTGEIGGSLSHEWHYLHETGEDTVFSCDNCGSVSNVEKTLSFPVEETEVADVSVTYFMTKDKSTLVCAYYPKDRELQPNFVKNEVPDLNVHITDQELILAEFSDPDTLISKKIIRIMDARLNSRSNFPDFPISFINRSLITTLSDIPIVSAEEFEICGECEDGKLHGNRAIEIGHTFYLGDKYSKPLGCSVEVPVGNKTERKDLMMGCYGIGVSRIIASIGEINKDDKGLNWPRIVAPWEVTVVEAGNGNKEFEEVYRYLNQAGLDYRADNRPKVGLGKKINQSNLMGIPITVILGKKFPIIELEIRGKKYGDSWKQVYESRDFEWEVEYENGQDIKHFVHKDGLSRALEGLLEDM
ncbi:prolyl-tRNA synthetase [Suhomyces tanzawaensis NRRL Y-17324]|uniref:proline--tRNA ligase n=1 Tax=Suhomyces tanzawaensis NRRL Y-17324 TaxID=984487 RepID=A0A1E4SKB8_9ASCO|nr:prolyl-tRNA synthetase [Suhomyces tanzawaensis NRRL Y-17324]ODV79872.1 prolyl-tRNA synthetase [Suhomyces tanzawaensis NRRL Y-17324]